MRKLIVLLGMLLSASVFSTAQNSFCWHTAPNPITHEGCVCVLQQSPYYCWCESNGNQCVSGGICPETCQIGTNPTAKEQQQIHDLVARHKTTVVIFMRKECAEGKYGQFLMKETIAQGKSLHIVTPPELHGKAEIDAYNAKLALMETELSKEEQAADAAKVEFAQKR